MFYITLISVTIWNEGTLSQTLSVKDLPVILKWDNLQSLDKAFDFLIALKILQKRFPFSEQAQKYKMATNNIVSVYIYIFLKKMISAPNHHCCVLVYRWWYNLTSTVMLYYLISIIMNINDS